MAKTSPLISSFIRSLETHPNGKEIIVIIEDILADDSGVISSSLLASLKELSDHNVSLLVDFWILRGSIFKEEGRDQDAVRMFFEAIQWNPNDVKTWMRISDLFKTQGELFKASFFLVEAQKRSGSHHIITDESNGLLRHLEASLAIPPGLEKMNHDEKPPQIPPPPPSSPSQESLSLPPEASPLWNHALECFEEGTKRDDLIYLNAFIHYAHSTVREVLGLDGNFKAGLDAKVSQYGLFQYQRFFNRLNSLRNAVVHDNYLLSKEEAQEILTQITEFLSFMQNQQI